LELAKSLLEKDKIFTVGYDQAGVHGVRITPHLFTQPKELDKLVTAIARYAKHA
jgi:selenocysteine lyase/cysteine desulfurase